VAQRTVVGIIRCRPGQMDEVARQAVERYRSRSETGSGRIDSYLFEDRADPSLVVSVSRWESRTAFAAMLGRLGVIGGQDLYEGEPSFTFFRPLLRYVRMFEPSEIATLTIVEGDITRAVELRDYVVSNRKRMDLRAMGIVEHEIGEDEDRPGRFAFFVRWRTAAAVEAGRSQVRVWLDPAVASFGATIRRYDGRVRAETSLEPTAAPADP
jgi:heme-degrading monooxygenase HmoA